MKKNRSSPSEPLIPYQHTLSPKSLAIHQRDFDFVVQSPFSKSKGHKFKSISRRMDAPSAPDDKWNP